MLILNGLLATRVNVASKVVSFPSTCTSRDLRLSCDFGHRSRVGFSCPVRTVEAAVLDGFGDVFGLDRVGAFEVGDGAGDFQDAVVGAGAEALLGHGAFEQAFAIGGEGEW